MGLLGRGLLRMVLSVGQIGEVAGSWIRAAIDQYQVAQLPALFHVATHVAWTSRVSQETLGNQR
ncbi:hypothetical protein X755_01075 [Mesorhizobium sp. LNJC405B00]|nr:hypothetical protein X755_01075 [Mesorhizobium sp. LNJC405B00]